MQIETYTGQNIIFILYFIAYPSYINKFSSPTFHVEGKMMEI